MLLGKGQAGVPSLEKGAIDALIVDEFGAVATARASNGRLRVLSEPVALERYAFVLPKGRDELKLALDRALEELEREGLATLPNAKNTTAVSERRERIVLPRITMEPRDGKKCRRSFNRPRGFPVHCRFWMQEADNDYDDHASRWYRWRGL